MKGCLTCRFWCRASAKCAWLMRDLTQDSAIGGLTFELWSKQFSRLIPRWGDAWPLPVFGRSRCAVWREFRARRGCSFCGLERSRHRQKTLKDRRIANERREGVARPSAGGSVISLGRAVGALAYCCQSHSYSGLGSMGPAAWLWWRSVVVFTRKRATSAAV